jgi:hypothetical protein
VRQDGFDGSERVTPRPEPAEQPIDLKFALLPLHLLAHARIHLDPNSEARDAHPSEGISGKHDLEEGDALHLIDLGGGAFVLTLSQPRIPKLSSALERIREKEGISIDDMLEGLREQRQHYDVETG